MIDSLRHLLLIVEHGTFTEAAKHAHLSQPALTASIRRLEQELGASVLERGRRGAALTAHGEALMPHARAVLAAVEDARRAIVEVEGLERGEVRIGAGGTACAYLLPDALASFRREHPRIRYRLLEQPTGEALESLERGDIDLAIVTSERGDRWRDDALVLVGAPGCPAGAPLVTFRPGGSTRAALDRHFPDREIAMELGNVGAILSYVRAGIGVALVSRYAASSDLARGDLVEIRNAKTPIRRPLRLVHRGLDRLSPAARALRDRLLEKPARGRR